MGTFHDGLGELHGITVVVDTTGPRIAVGRCHTSNEQGVVLHDAEVHDEDESGLPKVVFLKRAARVGPWPNHRALRVPADEVAAVTPLSEIE